VGFSPPIPTASPTCHRERRATEELALSEAEGVVEWEGSGQRI